MKKGLSLAVVVSAALLVFANVASASVFSIWADTSGDGIKDLLLGSISGYEGTLSGKDNYDYYSSSGHPVNGPEPQAHRLKIFIYENTLNGRAFLNLIAGKDGAGTHSYSGMIDITGSILDPEVKRSDDAGELVEGPDDHFEGNWSFHNNSDGGVIGPLKGDWEAMITPGEGDDGLRSHGFYSSDGSVISLDGLDQSYHFFVSTDVVPEPASLALLGLGLLGLARRFRKNN